MSKIICDVCGTSYPDTATQCPICGSVRSGDAKEVSAKSGADSSGRGYTYVKGGRFSKANVRKHNKGKYSAPRTARGTSHNQERPENANTGLIVTIIILLLAIICVVAFLVIRYFLPSFDDPNQTKPSNTNSVSTEATIPAVSIRLDVNEFSLETIGSARMIYARVLPSNTTDVVSFASQNPEIATVSKEGKVTAVSPGRTVILVTCGSTSAQCIVSCDFADPTETTTPTTEPTEPIEELKLNRVDITFSFLGETWVLYDGKINKSEITWTSDNTSVVTFENGKATAVGSGTTNIHAEYNGQKVSCIIRCNFTNSGGVSGSGGGGISEDG